MSTEIQPLSLNQVNNDQHLLRLWLHGRSENTIQAYLRDIEQFMTLVGKPFPDVTLDDIQQFDDMLRGFAESTRKRKLYAVKSILAFGHRLGYLLFNVGAPARVPAVKETIAERILDKSDLLNMLQQEPDPRNHAILTLLYGSGIRVSELTALCWRDVRKRKDGGQITVFGKGGKTRTILLSDNTFRELSELRAAGNEDSPLFPNKKGVALHRMQIYRIVRKAAERCGLWQKVSPHWMRHAHASHALDSGAPIHLVQATLGHASVATTGKYAHARPDDSSAKYLDI